MICPYCRAENIEGADECVNCGQALYGLDLPGEPQGSQAPDFIHTRVSSLPARPPATVGPQDPVSLAVRLMQQQETGCVLVIDGGELMGIITGRDILYKVAGATEDLTAVTSRQVMTSDPQCLHEEDSIALALNLMASGDFRHVPILRDDKPVSVIDVNDVFRFISPHLV
jgi:CBS domain-containing protein